MASDDDALDSVLAGINDSDNDSNKEDPDYPEPDKEDSDGEDIDTDDDGEDDAGDKTQVGSDDEVPIHSDDDEDTIAAREAELKKKKTTSKKEPEKKAPEKKKNEAKVIADADMPSKIAVGEDGIIPYHQLRLWNKDELDDPLGPDSGYVLRQYTSVYDCSEVDDPEWRHITYAALIKKGDPRHKTTIALIVMKKNDKIVAEECSPQTENELTRKWWLDQGNTRWSLKQKLNHINLLRKDPNDPKGAALRKRYHTCPSFGGTKKNVVIVMSTLARNLATKIVADEEIAAEKAKEEKAKRKAEREEAKAEKARKAAERAAEKERKEAEKANKGDKKGSKKGAISAETVEEDDMDLEDVPAGPARPEKKSAKRKADDLEDADESTNGHVEKMPKPERTLQFTISYKSIEALEKDVPKFAKIFGKSTFGIE